MGEVACDILKDQDQEKATVAMICSKQTKVPKDECEAGLSKIWEMVAEKECPATLAALPEVACEILKDQDKEKVAVGMICEKLSSQVPQDECEAGLKMIWEQVAEKECPSAVGALPDAACQILKDQTKESAAVQMICSKQSKVPEDECEAGLKRIWELVAE